MMYKKILYYVQYNLKYRLHVNLILFIVIIELSNVVIPSNRIAHIF
jgi:hypothetical protein